MCRPMWRWSSRLSRRGGVATAVALAAVVWLGATAGAPTPALAESPAEPPAEPSAERQESLRHLVRHDCGSCHGMTLKGGLGRALLPENLDGFTAEDVAELILDGVSGTPMPPWRGQIAPAEAMWIARKLKEGFPE